MFQTMSVEEAVSQAASKDQSTSDRKGRLQPVQPLLFRCQSQYYVLADKLPIAVTTAGCFTDAVEFLFNCFFVFNVQYPWELQYFYCFIEEILQLPRLLPNSVILADFSRQLSRYLPNSAC